MQIIKDGSIVDDDIQHLADDASPTGRFTVSLARWLAEKPSLASLDGFAGVRLRGGDAIADLAQDLPNLALVVLEFPALADGRGFSFARLLRDRHHYTGEIRALGGFIRDQVYFLRRVGVNAFQPADGSQLPSLLSAFGDFTHAYQTGADTKTTIARLRGL